MALGAHGERCGLDLRAVHSTEDLQGLALDFFFFLVDEGQHVVGRVERSHAGIASAGESLHSCSDSCRDAESRVEWRERQSNHYGRAVRIRDDEAALGKS